MGLQQSLMAGDAGMARLIREPMPGMVAARAMAHNLVDELAAWTTLPISRIVLGGFSQGAMMTLEAGVHLRESPAALLLFSGFPLTVEAVAKEMKRHKGLPVYQVCGAGGRGLIDGKRLVVRRPITWSGDERMRRLGCDFVALCREAVRR